MYLAKTIGYSVWPHTYTEWADHGPKEVIELPTEICTALWHDNSGSHKFTGSQGELVRQYVRSRLK